MRASATFVAFMILLALVGWDLTMNDAGRGWTTQEGIDDILRYLGLLWDWSGWWTSPLL